MVKIMCLRTCTYLAMPRGFAIQKRLHANLWVFFLNLVNNQRNEKPLHTIKFKFSTEKNAALLIGSTKTLFHYDTFFSSQCASVRGSKIPWDLPMYMYQRPLNGAS